jgi:hypothetical protein
MATKPTKTTSTPTPKDNYNGMAIAGGVCSFFFSILGLIFSIIGFNQIKTSGEKGRGLAIAGIAISAASIVLTVIAIVFAIIFGFWVANTVVDGINNCQWTYDYTASGYTYEYQCR